VPSSVLKQPLLLPRDNLVGIFGFLMALSTIDNSCYCCLSPMVFDEQKKGQGDESCDDMKKVASTDFLAVVSGMKFKSLAC
jgi:hypothetical protein